MEVYGRQGLVEALDRARASVTVVSGDSGIGKSAVLSEAQRQTATRGHIAPSPLTVPWSGAVLQIALLEALSAAVASYAEHREPRELVRNIGEAVDRLVERHGPQLAKLLARECLALVRGRLGYEFGQGIEEYLSELRTSVDERLTARLSAATDRGVIKLVADFAAEVRELTGERDIYLSLDAAERFRDEDVRVLADLVGEMPAGVFVRLGFATYTQELAERAQFLVRAGLHDVPVEPLGVDAIATWLTGAGLDRRLTSDVARLTGGYPLHVYDLIGHLNAGGGLDEMPRNQRFVRLTEESWRALDNDVATHARTLSAFPDPPPWDRTLALLGMDATAYGQVEDRLWAARIFSVEVNGRRWFHEQRRVHLLDAVLGKDEQAAVCERAARALYDQLVETGDTTLVAPIAQLVAKAPGLQAADAQVAAAVALDSDELAVGAALIELVEPGRQPLVEADPLLRYARAVFSGAGDLVAALESFRARGLAVVVNKGPLAVVVPYGEGALARAVIAGRAARELGRMPVPGVATAVFDDILRRVKPFEVGALGMGAPSMAKLSADAIELRRRRQSGLVVVGPVDPGSNLLLRGDYAGRPLYAALTFASSDARDNALAAAQPGTSGEVLGATWRLADAMRHPADVVSSRRFLSAASRLLGHTLGSAYGSGASAQMALAEPMPYNRALDLKAALLAHVRNNSSQLERYALGLEEPVAFVYFEEDDFRLEVEVVGGRQGVDRLQRLPDVGGSDDPFKQFRLARALNLQPHEQLGRIRNEAGAASHEDPVVAVLEKLAANARAFNREQQVKRVVRLDEGSLHSAIQKASTRQFDDARALAEAVPLGGERRSAEPRQTFAIVDLDPPIPGVVPGGLSAAYVKRVTVPGGAEQVHVAVVRREQAGTSGVNGQSFERLFGGDAAGPGTREEGSLRGVVAGLLGHTEHELAFADPADERLVM